MKPAIIFLLLFSACAANAQFMMEDFKPLYQLSGSWEMKTKTSKLVEEWKIVHDSLLTSNSYRIKNGDTIPQETAELRFSNGEISFVPTVDRQNNELPVVFKLSSIDLGNYKFLNPGHDFPQWIVYTPGAKILRVIIGGRMDGENKEIPFIFKKIK